MTALGEGDQVLATFLKGLELYQPRSSIARRCSSRIRCRWRRPSRRRGLFLGASLAEGNRHKDAAGLLQSASTTPPNAAIARLAGEEWIKAGQPALAIAAARTRGAAAERRSARRRKLLGIAYVLGGRGGDAVAVLTPYLETNPTDTAGTARGDLRHLHAASQCPAAGDAHRRSREPREVVEGVHVDEGPDAAARRCVGQTRAELK